MFYRLRLAPLLATAAVLSALCVLASDVARPARAATSEAEAGHELPYALRPDVESFAREVAQRRNMDFDWVRSIVGQAIYQPRIPPLMIPPSDPGAKDWSAYRARFIEPTRIRAGIQFWRRNSAALARAESEFGVPPAIIVGILGVETIYGRNTGRTRVLDALATLAFDFPSAHPQAEKRQAYFREELESFLVLCRDEDFSPDSLRGSYAGAMGIPQFMPSSWNRWAVDFDGDGRIDLQGSEADAIGSVANYFKAHGWQPGLPTHYAVRLMPGADRAALLAPDIEPTFTATEFERLGARIQFDGPAPSGKLALVELPNGDPTQPGHDPDYVAGTQNFYVVTRYNQSSFYAMAVIELGERIAAAVAP